MEVVGNFTKRALKDSSGDKEWLYYCKCTNVEFVKLEKSPIDESYKGINYLKKLQEFGKTLAVKKDLEHLMSPQKLLLKEI